MKPRKPKLGKSLADLSPEIAQQWSPKNNLTPFDYTNHSSQKVWWICPIHGDYEMICNSRTGISKSGCPKCRYNRSATKLSTPALGKSLGEVRPNLCKDWSSKNTKSPFDVYPNSNYRVQWVCYICGHSWETPCYSRRNCPNCSKKQSSKIRSKAPYEKSIAYLYPNLLIEWSPNNIKKPENVYAGSNYKASWICKKHGEYTMSCKNRTGTGATCLKCKYEKHSKNRAIPNIGSSLGDLYPNLAKEWSENNDKTPFDVHPGSKYKAEWVCHKNHKWKSTCHNRTKSIKPTGCPECITWGTSKAEISLRKGLILYGGLPDQYRIGRYTVDIYIPNINTVVEYDGSFWHNSEESNRRDLRKSLDLLSKGYNILRVRTSSRYFILKSLQITNYGDKYKEIFCEEDSTDILPQILGTLGLLNNNT